MPRLIEVVLAILLLAPVAALTALPSLAQQQLERNAVSESAAQHFGEAAFRVERVSTGRYIASSATCTVTAEIRRSDAPASTTRRFRVVLGEPSCF